jgi:hypothetical protein
VDEGCLSSMDDQEEVVFFMNFMIPSNIFGSFCPLKFCNVSSQ